MINSHSQTAEEDLETSVPDSLIQTYASWLTRSDSGFLLETSVTNMLGIVKELFSSETLFSLQDLMDQVKISNYFQEKNETGKWDYETCATYLLALMNFYKFLQTTYFKKFYDGNTPIKQMFKYGRLIKDASQMVDNVKRLASTYNDEN